MVWPPEYGRIKDQEFLISYGDGERLEILTYNHIMNLIDSKNDENSSEWNCEEVCDRKMIEK